MGNPSQAYQDVMSVLVRVLLDTATETYKVESSVIIDKDVCDEGVQIPRDLMLGLVVELRRLANRVCRSVEVSDDEVAEFVQIRELVSSTDDTDVDKAIKNLFKDDQKYDPDESKAQDDLL